MVKAVPLRIEALQECHFDKLHDLFDAICREKRFLIFTRAGSREDTFTWYRRLLEYGETHFVALQDDDVIGWCDVVAQTLDARKHVGTLGIAIRRGHRGQGIGPALMQAALEHTQNRGLRRIELTVRADNLMAQRLYRRCGFELEGVQKQGWCIDGGYHDVYCMARLAHT